MSVKEVIMSVCPVGMFWDSIAAHREELTIPCALYYSIMVVENSFFTVLMTLSEDFIIEQYEVPGG